MRFAGFCWKGLKIILLLFFLTLCAVIRFFLHGGFVFEEVHLWARLACMPVFGFPGFALWPSMV